MQNNQSELNKKAALNSLSWIILTSFLGLIQLWLTLGISYIIIPENYNLLTAIQDGVLLFFVMAVVTTLTIDYHFTTSLPIPQWTRSVMFTFFPLLIAIFVTTLYVTLYLTDRKQVDVNTIATIQYAVIIMTIVYALATKYIMFLYQEVEK